MADDQAAQESSTFSYIWYTAIWYLIQFLVIATLHFLANRQLDKRAVQKAASDTLLLALVFLSLQWSQRFFSYAIYRLPYVFIHLFMDMIPTAVWLGGSVLLLLECLGLAQKLYGHLTGTKMTTSAIDTNLAMTYFTSITKSQARIEDAIHKHMAKQFPKLVRRLEQPLDGSPALTVLFTSASLLLQLSSLGLAFVDASWLAVKTGYHRLSQQRMKDMKIIVQQLAGLVLSTLFVAGLIQYRVTISLLYLARQAIWKVSSSHNSSRNKSMKANNGTSASEHDDTINDASGDTQTTDEWKHHDD